ncbi:polyisoprenoid-binding protein [Aureimonas ureilytica]|uniref:Polyisoprenoid-binding protein n=1 Tax=Aureimonas ureilytica TaxID=401562 RepID=A0A175RJB9_9HYPH|nr:YceI family protein [Aureimonas ureilytica]KTR03870.1 polyisoprenoid-binding protein [Aureimonas ureilytica]
MSLLKSVLTVSALLVGLGTASAQTIGVPAGTYVADRTHTNVLWSVSHFGTSNYIGRFSDINATLTLDPTDPDKSKLTATINPKSVDTNYPAKDKDFNAEIAGEMFLDAAKFDTIKFVSTKIETTGKDTGKVTGDLTLHGVTKPVTLDVKLNAALNPHPMSQKPVVGFSATGMIKRSDFGINALVGPVSDDVKLTIETEFVPQS